MADDEQMVESLSADAPSGGSAVRTGCLWMFGALLVFALFVSGWFLLGDSVAGFRLWRERPHETVQAKLTDVSTWYDDKSDSGRYYTGEYTWYHAGSSGVVDRGKKYEELGEVPNVVSVTVYLGEDDAWHTLGDNGNGIFDFVGNLLSGGVVMVVAVLVCLATLRSMVLKLRSLLKK